MGKGRRKIVVDMPEMSTQVCDLGGLFPNSRKMRFHSPLFYDIIFIFVVLSF